MTKTQHNKISPINEHFDAFIVFGYGPVLPGPRPGSGRLNEYGRIAALGAGMLYRACHTTFIIPTGGKTGGSDKPAEAELIAKIIVSRFNISEDVFIIENKASNTILNIVYSANIIDRIGLSSENLLFVAMGFHIPRIKEICSIVGLYGHFVAAEKVVEKRSRRHRKLLSRLLSPERERYAKALAEQERWLRGLKEIPEYWLPEMANIENDDRFLKVLQIERIRPFLQYHGTDPGSTSPDDLRMWLRTIPRKLPAP